MAHRNDTGLSNHPLVVTVAVAAGIVGIISSCLFIYSFVSGSQSLPKIQDTMTPTLIAKNQSTVAPSPIASRLMLSTATSSVSSAPMATSTPTPARQPPITTPTVIWTVDVVGIPTSGNEISWELNAGFVLMFGGGQFNVNGSVCKVNNPQKEICILLYKATKSQTVTIKNVNERGNRIGVTDTANPVDALKENERLLWQPPNCDNKGCTVAFISYFTDGQLTGTETRTPTAISTQTSCAPIPDDWPKTPQDAARFFGGQPYNWYPDYYLIGNSTRWDNSWSFQNSPLQQGVTLKADGNYIDLQGNVLKLPYEQRCGRLWDCSRLPTFPTLRLGKFGTTGRALMLIRSGGGSPSYANTKRWGYGSATFDESEGGTLWLVQCASNQLLAAAQETERSYNASKLVQDGHRNLLWNESTKRFEEK